MKKSMRNIIIVLFIVICGASIAYYALKPIELEVIEAQNKDLVDYIEEDGKVISYNETYLTPKVSSQIVEIHKSNGDKVKKGDLIVSLDDSILKNQLAVLDAQILAFDEEKKMTEEQLTYQISEQKIAANRLKNAFDFAKDNYNDGEKLRNAGSISENEFNKIKQAYKDANGAYNQALESINSLESRYRKTVEANGSFESLKMQYNNIQLQIENSKIYSLSDGVIEGFDVKLGEFVSPQIRIGKVIDNNRYLVKSYVLTEDILELNINDIVDLVIKKSGEELVYKGKVKEIANNAEDRISSLGVLEQRVKVLVESDEINDYVKSGYKVKTKFITEKKENAIAIPKTSIFYEEDDSYVFLVKNDEIIKQKIELGMDTDSKYSIDKGINTGDLIIKNYKSEGIKIGKKVKPILN